jgi:signal transduction histidine kinase
MTANIPQFEELATAFIGRIIRAIEWVILGVLALILLWSGAWRSWHVMLPILVTWTGLSFVFPVSAPVWQRRTYIALEILLAIVAKSFDWGVDLLLYLFIAKGCFLLNRRDLTIVILTTGIAWLVPIFWLVPQAIAFRRTHPDLLFNTQQLLISHFMNDAGAYLAASTFVVLFSFTLIAEGNSRRRAERLTQEVETLAIALERTRIARDIHDSLGHTLTTLNVQLKVVKKLQPHDLAQALQALDTATSLAGQCLVEVRRAVQTLRPSEFDLNAAFQQLAAHVQNPLLTIRVETALPVLPLQKSHQIYCIVQEGLTNIQRHAHATQVILNSQSTPDHITIVLKDNGQGFDVNQPGTGFGLQGMRERVHLMGGELRIQSTLGQGTHLRIQIPR